MGEPDIPPSILTSLMHKNLPPFWTRHGCYFLSSDSTHAAVPVVVRQLYGSTATGGFPITSAAAVNFS
jgi:hypothetical protein